MKKLLIALVLLLALSGCAAEPLPVPELTLALASDLHYLSPTLTDYGPDFIDLLYSSDGKVTQYTPQLTDAFVARLLALQPDYLLLTGDLTLNGAEASHRELADKLRALEAGGTQVLVLPGNHDAAGTAYTFFGEWAKPIESVDQAGFAEIWADFGLNQALSRDGASLSYCYQLDPALRLLCLDANTAGVTGSLSDDTMKWIELQLKDARRNGVTVIAAAHQNLLQHNPNFAFGYLLNQHDDLLALLKKYNVKLHLSGHMHIQHIAQQEGVTEIASSSLAVTRNQYGILEIGPAGMDYRTAPVDVAGWASETGQTDPELLDFDRLAADMFNHSTDIRTREALTALGYQGDQLEQLVDYAKNYNLRYFAGTTGPDMLTDPAWALWQTLTDRVSFASYMHNTLSREEPRDQNTVYIPFD